MYSIHACVSPLPGSARRIWRNGIGITSWIWGHAVICRAWAEVGIISRAMWIKVCISRPTWSKVWVSRPIRKKVGISRPIWKKVGISRAIWIRAKVGGATILTSFAFPRIVAPIPAGFFIKVAKNSSRVALGG